jgi:hypothetical protein
MAFRLSLPGQFSNPSVDVVAEPRSARRPPPSLRSRILGAEMARLGKLHRVKIYPPVGRTADEGHDFVDLRVATWEPDVFAFLNERMRR